MIRSTKVADDVYRLEGEGPISFSNRSGNVNPFSPDATQLAILDAKANAWATVELEDLDDDLIQPEYRMPVIASGSKNADFMWGTEGTRYWMLIGDTLTRDDGQATTTRERKGQFRSGTGAGRKNQFFWDYTQNPNQTAIIPFDGETGQTKPRFSLLEASVGQHSYARNIQPYTHPTYGHGFLISPHGINASFEYFVGTNGNNWHRFEPMDDNGQHRWSHQATEDTNFVAARPYMGTVESFGKSGQQELFAQTDLKELTGRETFINYWHGALVDKVLCFSTVDEDGFEGIYILDSGNGYQVSKAFNRHVTKDDFASMARPGISRDGQLGRWVAWHEKNLDVAKPSPVIYVARFEPELTDLDLITELAGHVVRHDEALAKQELRLRKLEALFADGVIS